jgi:hypothetical protein
MVTSPQGQSNRLLEVTASQRQDLEAMFERLETGATDPKERREHVGDVMNRLSRHISIRQQLLYPRVRQDVSDGDSCVDLALIGQEQVERTSREIVSLTGTELTFEFLVAKLGHEVREYFDEEEFELLPPLVDAIGINAANELGDQLARADDAVSPR